MQQCMEDLGYGMDIASTANELLLGHVLGQFNSAQQS